MSGPASGSSTTFSLGPERAYGVPGSQLIAYGAVLPVAAEIIPSDSPSGQLNPSGYLRSGVPGPITGPVNWGHPLTASHQLESFEHILGRSEKTVLEPGVYRYRFWPSKIGCVNTSFRGLFAKSDIEIWQRHGIVFSSMSFAVGGNSEIVATLTGEGGNFSRLSPAEAALGNAGTYALGPHTRGPLAVPTAGDLWVRVESLAPLVVKVLQTAAEPDAAAWAAAAGVFQVPIRDGEGQWMWAMSSANGADLGSMDCDKNPLEIVFPGDAADHANLSVGDVFRFATSWLPPALAEITGAQCLTPAHWLTEIATPDPAPTWEPVELDSGQFTLAWPTTPRSGGGSRYRTSIPRTGLVSATASLVRDFDSREQFADRSDRSKRIAFRSSWVGRQLGALGNREGIVITYPSMAVTSVRPVSNPEIIQETANLNAETNAAGDPPLEIEVITTRDWTPSPQG